MYMVISGNCNLVCRDTKNMFKKLEHEDDPTRITRDKERKKYVNPFKGHETARDKFMLRLERGAVPPED